MEQAARPAVKARLAGARALATTAPPHDVPRSVICRMVLASIASCGTEMRNATE